MITTYSSRDYRITYQGIALIENALERPDLVQVSVVSGCTILVAPQKEYGIDYEPNGEYRYWYMEGMNTRLVRAEAHYIYVRLNRNDKNALLLFSVNDYDTDGKINGEGAASEDYYYIKIGDITKTDSVENPTLDREITIDFGYLSTPAGSDNDDGWRKLFEVTADDLIRPLKKFSSYIIQGTLDIVGKIVLNEKQVSDIARQGDQEVFKESDDMLPTTRILTGKYLDVIRKVFLNKDREDSTDFVQTFKKGIKVGDYVPGMFGGGGAVLIGGNKDSVAEFDKMTIRKKAYFNTLGIMETELAGAELLFNSSGARIKITKVEVIERKSLYDSNRKGIRFKDGKRAFTSGGTQGSKVYRCYFLNDDGDAAVENRFHVGNLARSQTFNIKAGIYENISNHYWWRMVTAVGDNYIELSDVFCDKDSDIPAVDDVVVQLGDINDSDYQSAISLSAYGDGAPSLTFYTGINSFSLSGKDVFTIAYDRVEQECYIKSYGRMYIGDREEKSYLKFTKKYGLEVRANRFLFSNGEDIETRIEATERNIALKLGETGIDIENREISITADRFKIQDSNGTGIAVFKMVDGKPLLRAENIDVENLKVKRLDGATGTFSGELMAATGTFGGEISANGARIGGFTMDNGSMHWKGNDYFGGDSRSIRLGVPSDNNSGMLDISFNGATQGRFGVKIIGSNLGGACIYASRYGTNKPVLANTYAGYFDGGVHVEGNVYTNIILSNEFGTDWTLEDDGTYTYQKGVTEEVRITSSNGTPVYRLCFKNGILIDTRL